MTREQFSAEFVRGLRYVIQKHDRVNDAARHLREGSAPFREDAYHDAYHEAQNNLDGALIQLADHLYDALETAMEPNVT